MAQQFGVSRLADATYGLVQNVETEEQSETAEAVDGAGDVSAIQTYNRNETISFEVVYDSAKSLPDTGDDVTINSNKYRIQGKTESEVNDDFRKATVTGQRWIANTVPA